MNGKTSREITSSPGAIRSLVFFASSVMTASSLSQVLKRPWPRPSKPKEPVPHPHTISAAKNPRRKFKLFPSKIKRSSKISVCVDNMDGATSDDDSSLAYSDIGYSRSYTCSSVPNLSSTLSSDTWDNSPSTSTLGGYQHHSLQQETLPEEDEDAMKIDQDPAKEAADDEDDLNWDMQSDNGCLETLSDANPRPVSSPIPIAAPPHNRRHHHRAISLPQNSIQDLPKSLYHRQPTPSESWDNDFEVPEDFQVPSQVQESQIYIRMGMVDIQDFRTQIEELKSLRTRKLSLASTVQSKLTQKKWGNTIARKNSKIFKNLEEMFKSEWEETNVIIDISDMAQDREPRLDHGESVELGTDEQHLRVLRKMIDETVRDDDAFIVGALDDDNKENDITNFVFPPPNESCNSSAKQTNTNCLMGGFDSEWSFHGQKRNHSGLVNSNPSSIAKKKRRENVRISVDEMPSLIDHLRRLQGRLSGHVDQLADLAALRSE